MRLSLKVKIHSYLNPTKDPHKPHRRVSGTLHVQRTFILMRF